MSLTPQQVVNEIVAAVDIMRAAYSDQFEHQFGNGTFVFPYKCNDLTMVFSGAMLRSGVPTSEKRNATVRCVLEGASFGTLKATADLLSKHAAFGSIAVNVHQLSFIVRAFA